MHRRSSLPRRSQGRRLLALALAALTLWAPLAQAAPAAPAAGPPPLAAARSRPPAPSTDEFLTGRDPADPLDIATRYLASQQAALGLADADLSEIEVTDRYVSSSGVTHLYLRQRLGGIPVFNGVININVMADGRVLNYGSRFVPRLAQAVNARAPALTPIAALQALAAEKGLAAGSPAAINAPQDQRETHLIQAPGLSLDPVPVRLMYQPLDQGGVRLAWDAVIRTPDGRQWLDVRIDALTGKTLAETNWINDESGAGYDSVTDAHLAPPAGQQAASLALDDYRVFALPAEHPNDTALARTLLANPADAQASPFGWHDTNGAAGAEFTTTQGNNAHAYTDTDNNNQPDAGSSPDGGVGLVFDFPLDLTTQEPADYQPAAVTNLFYMSNAIHDILYRYGFDEAAGNFQVNSYGRGGLGADSVQAEAQDGGGLVNANFATPPDGQRPRMQMYLGGRPFNVQVTAPLSVAGQYGAGTAGFGPQAFTLTAEVVAAIDGTAPTTDGCQTITSTIVGKIALIDRGTCGFAVKVKNAENMGAVGALIINNVPGNAGNMGGTDATINIPSLMISQADGARLRAELGNNLTVTLNRAGLQRDGSLDNAVIAHEYGHGLSNRLTGGPSNVSCLTAEEQAGEGWSDVLALILTAKASDTATTKQTIGTWLTGQPAAGGGFRQFPYTTDLAENPHTYDALKQPTLAVPHGVGSVWTAMLWEVYWNLVAEYGFDPDIYGGEGGNNLALQLILDGMKLQPCNPTFVEARDAIMAADLAGNDGVNRCAIWQGFAKRGLGYSASAGSAASRFDGTQAFDLPPLCFLDASPIEREICAGAETAYQIILGPELGTDPATLSVAGVPPGYGASISPNPVTPPATSELTLSSTGPATAGTYRLVVQATQPTQSYTREVTLHLSTAVPAATTLISPANGATNQPLKPTLAWTSAPGAHAYQVEVARDAGFTNILYAESETGTSVTLPRFLDGGRNYFWRVLAVNDCGAAPASPIFAFTVRTPPPILLVDDDNSTATENAFVNALDLTGRPYDKLTVTSADTSQAEVDSTLLDNYDMVIWHGGTGGTPSEASDAPLADMLNRGGCLWVSSQEYFARRGLTPFMNDYLGVADATDDAGQTVITATAEPYQGMGSFALSFPANNYADLLVPTASAQAAFEGNAGPAALAKTTDTYFTTYWAFPFEALPTAAIRQDAVERTLSLCVADTGISLAHEPAGALMPGQLITYTLEYSNAGRLVAAGGILTAAISPLLTNISITTTGVTLTPRPGVLYGWNAPHLATFEGGRVHISGVINPGLTANATLVSSVAIGSPDDVNPFNNGDVESMPVTVPQASLAPAALTVSEAAGSATLTVTLSAAPLAPVRLRLATADGTAVAGSDYQPLNAIITIPAGATQAGVTITLIDDNQPEPGESFTVTLSPVAGAGAAGTAAVTIADADRLRLYLPAIVRDRLP